MSKGFKRRPSQVPPQHFKNEWVRIFGNEKKIIQNKKSCS